jgi:hypothetical protein
MSFTEVTSAMGWSGLYEHCPCCNEGCKTPHFAPCVDRRHDTPQLPTSIEGETKK